MKVPSELIQYINKGLVWVSVDETHFNIGSYHNYGWAPRGEKAIGRSEFWGTEFFLLLLELITLVINLCVLLLRVSSMLTYSCVSSRN